MSYLTRRERDAVVIIATTFICSFLAGFLSYQIGGRTILNYDTALGLLMLLGLVYLGYRAIRRGVGYSISRYRRRAV